MAGRLEIRRWIRTGAPAHVVALADRGQIAGGLEDAVVIYDQTGERLLHYPSTSPGGLVPAHLLWIAPDSSRLWFATRLGSIVRLTLTQQPDSTFECCSEVVAQRLGEIATWRLDPADQSILIGSLGSHIQRLNADGSVAWKQATEESVWSVDLMPNSGICYAASAGTDTNVVLALDAANGEEQRRKYVADQRRVTYIAALATGNLAVVTIDDSFAGRIDCYDANLADAHWSLAFDEPITALAADREHPMLLVSIGYSGRISLIDAKDGRELASESLRTTVQGLAIASIRGRSIAAATQDGNLVMLRYLSGEDR